MNNEEIQGLIKEEDYEQVIKILESQLSETTQRPELISLLIKSYNEFAIELLDKNQPAQALDILKKAENFSDIETELRSRTYNNIACCYKVQNKHILALKYIEKAIFLHPSGDFHLNKCAILSMSGKHNKALEEAMFAVIYIQEEMLEKFIQNAEINKKKCEALAISYHNLAVELEYMRKVPESIGFYTKALNVCEIFFESEGKLKEKLEEDMQMALKALQRPLRKPQESIFPVYSKKKRIVIKNSHSKSPVIRSQNTPIRRTESKEQKKKFTGRKFVSTGMSKLKMIELRKTQPAKIEENESEEKFMKTERVFIKGIQFEDCESDERDNNDERIKDAERKSDRKSSFKGEKSIRNEIIGDVHSRKNSSKGNQGGSGAVKSDQNVDSEEYSEFNSSRKNQISLGKKEESHENESNCRETSNRGKNSEKFDSKSSGSSSKTSQKNSKKILNTEKKSLENSKFDHSFNKHKEKSDLSESKKFSHSNQESEQSSLHSLPSEYKKLMHEKSGSPKDSYNTSEKKSKKSSIYSEKEEDVEKWASIEKKATDSYYKNSSLASEKSNTININQESSKIKSGSNRPKQSSFKSSSFSNKHEKTNSKSSMRLLVDRKIGSEIDLKQNSRSSNEIEESSRKSRYSKAENISEFTENDEKQLENFLGSVYKNGIDRIGRIEEDKILESYQISEIKPKGSKESSISSVVINESLKKNNSEGKFLSRYEFSQGLNVKEKAANSQDFEIEKPLSSGSSLNQNLGFTYPDLGCKDFEKLLKNSDKSDKTPSISSKHLKRSNKNSSTSSKISIKSSKYPSISNKSPLKSDKNSLVSIKTPEKSVKNSSVSNKNSLIPNKSSPTSEKSWRSEPKSPKTQEYNPEKFAETFSNSKISKDIPKFKGLIIDTSFNETDKNLNSSSHISEKEEYLYTEQSSKISENEKITFYSKKPSIQDSLSQESINFSQNEYNEKSGLIINKEKSEETNLDTIKNLRPEENKKKSKKNKFELSADLNDSLRLEKLYENESEINIRSSQNYIQSTENPFNFTPKKNHFNTETFDPYSLCKPIIYSIISQILS